MVMRDKNAQRLAIDFADLCIKMEKYDLARQIFQDKSEKRFLEAERDLTKAVSNFMRCYDSNSSLEDRFPEIYDVLNRACNKLYPLSGSDEQKSFVIGIID